jgi:superfamily II DNA/RNA helicase
MKNDLKFVQPTPIQMQAIPAMMKNKDIIAHAETGSGKTLAYILPIISKSELSVESYQAIVIVPTRELAKQITRQFLVFNPHTKKVKILVTTPSRLLKILQDQPGLFTHIKYIVVDEADAMLDLGLGKVISTIGKNTETCEVPNVPSIAYFSATISEKLEKSISDLKQALEKRMGKESSPCKITKITIGLKNATTHSIQQSLVY